MHEFNLPAKKKPVTEKSYHIRPGEVKDISPEEWNFLVSTMKSMEKQRVYYRIYKTWTSTDDFYKSSIGF